MNVTDEMRRGVERIARSHGLKLVVLFGSEAAGTARPDSDVDVAVSFCGGEPSFGRLSGLQHEFSVVFGDRHVDLSVLDHADPLFMKKIAEKCAILFEVPGEARRFMLLSFKRYQDHRKYLAIERAYALEYVKRIAS